MDRSNCTSKAPPLNITLMNFKQISPIQYEWIFSKCTPISTLRDLATNKIVRDLWRDTLIKSHQNGSLINVLKKSSLYDLCFDVKRLEVEISLKNEACEKHRSQNQQLSISSKIQTIIQRRYLALQLNTIEWFEYHFLLFCDFFEGYFPDYLYIFDRFDELVYDDYDDIDYEETAKKMMNCAKFSALDKFIIACQYCFEDIISQQWPSVSQYVKPSHRFIFATGLIPFWISRMEKRNIAEWYSFIDNRSSMNWAFPLLNLRFKTLIIIMVFISRDIPAPYFLSTEGQEKRIPFIKIKTRQTRVLARYMLSEFGQDVFDVLIRFCGRLMIWYINNEEIWQFAIPIWLRIRNEISRKCFVEMFDFYYSVKTGHTAFKIHPRKLIESYQCDEITEEFLETTARQIRCEIWYSASKELREAALDYFRERHALYMLDFLYR